ncbi:MAG: hypothetical protein KA369_19165 [Spirochaetes bacterium]|nr:hypothetical protein [Spirochaetota bacterium]
MKKLFLPVALTLIGSMTFLINCTSKKSGYSADELLTLWQLSDYYSFIPIDPISNTYSKPTVGYEYYHLSIPQQAGGQNVTFDYTFDPNGSTKDVYFVFTNTDTTYNTSFPTVTNDQTATQSIVPDTATSNKTQLLNTASVAVKGKPEISAFNRNPYAYLNKVNPVNMLLSIVPSTEPKYDTAGNTGTFIIDEYGNTVSAICRYVSNPTVTTNNGNKKLNIWVANNCNSFIDDLEVEKLAIKFLRNESLTDSTTNTNNDIYDWVTGIFGAEYGNSNLSGSGWSSVATDAKDVLITPNDEITILLYDIDNDTSSGNVLGYFWAKDNFKKSSISYSNERIMFYMDAYIYDNRVPAITNGTNEIISAVAHELQHMIHFYQKAVIQTNGTGTETWIDEMCSMAAEDMIAYKLQVNGPRGVDWNVATEGSSGNTEGRLPLYNLYNDISVTTWYSGSSAILSYSINYALGAYLARNYGGVKFLYDIVHNTKVDYTAIEYALQQNGSSDSFATILKKWGVAVLLSDKTDTTLLPGYMYNKGNWFSSTSPLTSISYQAGSINLFNYKYVDPRGNSQNGPYLYEVGDAMVYQSMWPASNIYYIAADNLSAPKTWNIRLRSKVHMTILAR